MNTAKWISSGLRAAVLALPALLALAAAPAKALTIYSSIGFQNEFGQPAPTCVLGSAGSTDCVLVGEVSYGTFGYATLENVSISGNSAVTVVSDGCGADHICNILLNLAPGAYTGGNLLGEISWEYNQPWNGGNRLITVDPPLNSLLAVSFGNPSSQALELFGPNGVVIGNSANLDRTQEAFLGVTATPPTEHVPAPGSLGLLLVGLAGAAAGRRRQYA
jgi:hypothetical protein